LTGKALPDHFSLFGAAGLLATGTYEFLAVGFLLNPVRGSQSNKQGCKNNCG